MLPFPQKQILLKPCTHKQLAKSYGISGKVLTRWLKPYKEAQRSPKTNYTLTQLLFIVEKIGPPVHPLFPELTFNG